MGINVYLNFDGNCREAIEFYAEAFGVDTPQMMTFGEVPPDPNHPLPEEAKNRIMHARMTIHGSNVMFSDTFPGSPFTVGDNISLALVLDDVNALQSAFNKLKEGGTVIMELQETFWSKSYGSLTDKFGVVWQFNLGMNEM